MSLKQPCLLANVGVFDRGGCFVGYPDLLDLEAGLVIEYDGVDHLPEERRSKDVDREGEFRDLGLEVVHTVTPDRPRYCPRSCSCRNSRLVGP